MKKIIGMKLVNMGIRRGRSLNQVWMEETKQGRGKTAQRMKLRLIDTGRPPVMFPTKLLQLLPLRKFHLFNISLKILIQSWKLLLTA